MQPVLLFTLMTFFLSGCASFISKAPVTVDPVFSTQLEQRWERHQQTLSMLSTWTLKGKAAVSSHSQGGTANVIWQQQLNNYHLEIYGLLGQGRTKLIAKGTEVRLITQEGREWVATDAQRLLGEYAGWYLPVDNLYYWVRGIPAPTEITSLKLNNQGQLAQLQQAGWTMIYTEYVQINGRWLPKRITLTFPGDAFQPPLTMKWLSKEWIL